MTDFSTDADLLKWEPDVFRLAKMPAQKLAGSTSGSTSSGTATFTDLSADFVSAGIAEGHVVHLLKSGVYDLFLPVASIASATQLLLDAPTALFSTQSSVTYEIHTFDPQHEEAHFELCQRFDITTEGEVTFAEDELHDMRVLRRASAFRVLEVIFRAGASDTGDLFWQKAQVYGGLFATAVEAAKVRFDLDADGIPDSTRTGHSVRLTVEEQGDAWPA